MHLNVCACVVCFCYVFLCLSLCVCVCRLKFLKLICPHFLLVFLRLSLKYHIQVNKEGGCTRASMQFVASAHTHIYRGIAHDLLNQTHIIKQLAMCLFGHPVNIVTYLTRLWWIVLCPTKPWSHVTITVLRRKVRFYKSAHRVTGHRLSQSDYYYYLCVKKGVVKSAQRSKRYATAFCALCMCWWPLARE